MIIKPYTKKKGKITAKQYCSLILKIAKVLTGMPIGVDLSPIIKAIEAKNKAEELLKEVKK